MSSMEALEDFIAKRIVVKGLVQGIGYRPFVAELAEEYGITGWVRNTAGIVTIMAEGSTCQMEQFLSALSKRKPEGARVDAVEAYPVSPAAMDGFTIEESEKETAGREIPFIPPDLPTCPVCQKQLQDSMNRRYRYPFISCTACGPRYSILERLPYDRPSLTMRDFEMCGECGREYQSKGDIRRHAQTIACPDCGPKLIYTEIRGEADTAANQMAEAEEEKQSGFAQTAFERAVQCLKSGGIVAVKDIGGFHLACSPFAPGAVEALRLIKGREKKPFAVMFPDVETVRQYCSVDEREEEQLMSSPRPIVLLAGKKSGQRGNAEQEGRKALAENVCGNSPDIGAMLPCNPLQIMLMDALGPLVMTSANRSGELMITENRRMVTWMEEAAELLKEKAPVSLGVLQHDRRIVTPLDDSVVRLVSGRRQVFRRARGMVPEPVGIPEEENTFAGTVFAAGGDLKACFCFAGGGRAYLSQPFGDMEEEESLFMYTGEVKRMSRLFGFEPERIASDMHPAYLSVKLAEQLAEEGKGPCRIQHHHAHGASVIAEHGLKGKVLCVTFDGTGLGTDGSIWGSEFLLWDGSGIKRVAHLCPVLLPGGNEGAKNTDSVLYGYFASFGNDFNEYLRERLSRLPWVNGAHYQLVQAALEHGINGVTSSSMGRLFDAVSALLDVCHSNGYEGEAPIELEYLAAKTKKAYPLQIEAVWSKEQGALLGYTEHLFREMIDALLLGVPREELARGFILAAADFVRKTCSYLAGTIWERNEPRQIALGGGTFQNRILLEETIGRLEAEGFWVYINEQVPPGDGGICLGQAYLCRKMAEWKEGGNP